LAIFENVLLKYCIYFSGAETIFGVLQKQGLRRIWTAFFVPEDSVLQKKRSSPNLDRVF